MKDANETWQKLGAEMRILWSFGQLLHATEKHRRQLEYVLPDELIENLQKALRDVGEYLERQD